jgi:uncharacterized damage-inducible protein DinB
MNPENAKAMADFYIPIITQEVETNVRVFKAVPEDERDYRPHSDSMSSLELARHMSLEDVWFLQAVIDGQFGPMPAQGEDSEVTSVAEAIDLYNDKIPTLIEQVKSLSGEQLTREVSLMGVFNLPAIGFLSFMIRHTVHHRGQLSAYLRPMGSKVPQIYGGSADNPMELPEA